MGPKMGGDEIYGKGIHKWISDKAVNMKLRIAMEAHCEERGHRGFDTTLGLVERTHWLDEMEQDITKFAQSCIHYII